MHNQALVLLVDDAPQNIQVLGNILKNQGYSFALTTSGQETYHLLSRKLPDIILLDIMLPDEDGFSICEKIKSDPKTAGIPIIFLSAKHDIKDKIRAFELGAADYITKPFEDIEVIERVNNHLQAKLDRDKIQEYNSELERMVEQRTQELIQKERESILAQFMQGIIHNVRGPIASISNGMQLIEMMHDDLTQSLSEQNEISEKLGEIWEINSLNSKKASVLLHDLDSMLKKSRNDYSHEVELVDLNKIIEQEVNFLQVDLNFKHVVKKSIQLYDAPLQIKAIPAEISQIIQNLIKNSLDAMHFQQEKAITIESGKKGTYCFFRVSDNGPGIPEEYSQKIFDPFFTTKPKEHNNDNNNPTGTGIGLQFCKNTTEAYGGQIYIDTNYKEGASFIVELPLNQD